MANVVTNPTADQSIGAHNLLPASGNTTQSLGLSTARWNASLGTSDIKSMNGILNAIDFPGSDIGAQVNAAIAALTATGSGGTVFIPAGTISPPPYICRVKSNCAALPQWEQP
jgi:hypothetical protein